MQDRALDGRENITCRDEDADTTSSSTCQLLGFSISPGVNPRVALDIRPLFKHAPRIPNELSGCVCFSDETTTHPPSLLKIKWKQWQCLLILTVHPRYRRDGVNYSLVSCISLSQCMSNVDNHDDRKTLLSNLLVVSWYWKSLALLKLYHELTMNIVSCLPQMRSDITSEMEDDGS